MITKLWGYLKRVPEIAKSIVAGVGGILTALSALDTSLHVDVIPVAWQPYITFGLAILTGIAAWKVPNAPAFGIVRSHAKGFIPDVPDERDFERFFDKAKVALLPAAVSLRAKFSAVYDQGPLGSCTANAAAAVYDFVRRNVLGKKFLTPSRLFIYYFERKLEGTVSTDSGAQVRDSLKVLHQYGVPPESLWKYVVSKFATAPSAKARAAAPLNEALVYARVQQTAPAMKQILASGLPILIGFTCYPGLESAETAKTGILPMPAPGEQSIGGHAVVIVGYDLINGEPYWEVRNSWGKAWGDHGYFWVPEEYFTNPALASDFWVLDKVS